ncbi:DMT family transporter [Phaeobacter italicus]|jgi:drug/metabolite transporter (DMT)-like permease|uniref:DMT family transporter n=1 Tax=Phaeobacter italicus TaxID=481446 RepID=UPI00056B7381|nr:DMT family transporter [Phaeobacter italicus]MCA0856618.1 DMT family transporter [Phaeobacter italicus]MCI5101988.1 DMT family transporter [Phaeobacter italicus]CRL13889.1 phosphonate utilization associated putative membrane protein [Phaeobacter italicus]SFG08412.1 Permease of the drug/metabolite transporter (DMT) superfamily [Phaeobacter italicus]GLO74846.1 membrane protein [Phaeobacter italicus]
MNNVTAILLIIVSMAGFTLEDTVIKQLAKTMPVGQILVMLGIGSGAVFVIWAKLQGHRVLARHNWRWRPVLRASTEALAAVSFATALATVDISTVAAVFQAMPLAVTMGAALFLGEEVGWRRWSAILVGFLGVLMIVRPGLAGFEPNVLLVLVAVVAVAARDLMTRVMDSAVPSTVVSSQAFGSLVVGGMVMLWTLPGEPVALGQNDWLLLAAGIGFGVLAYSCIVTATRIGDAAVVTPFRYTRLVFSIAVGVVIFGEQPDMMTLGGSALIIGSGLYAFVRERRLARRARAAQIGAELQASA